MNWIRINQALQFAAKAHDGQYYKYNENEPQISHLYFCLSYLQYFGFDEDTLIAGVLHDTLEDTEATSTDIKKFFGNTVSSIVEEVTYDQSLPWNERQKHMQQSIEKASESAKAVKLADVSHQLILFIDKDKQRSAINNYLKKHSVEDVIWKYSSLMDSIGKNWDHKALEQAKELFEKFKTMYS